MTTFSALAKTEKLLNQLEFVNFSVKTFLNISLYSSLSQTTF